MAKTATHIYNVDERVRATRDEFIANNTACEDADPGWTQRVLAAIDSRGYALCDAGNGDVSVLIAIAPTGPEIVG